MSDFDKKMKSSNFMKSYTKYQSGTTKGLLYVENAADRLFWENVVAHVCPQSYIVKTYSISKAPGKRTLEKEYEKLHKEYIVGVDGDFDYLCPDRHKHATMMNSNPYVLHTFCYSRESIFFSIDSVDEIINRLFFRTKTSDKLASALTEYSKVIFPALSVFSYAHNKDWGKFKENDFNKAISLPFGQHLLTQDLEINTATLEGVKHSVDNYIDNLKKELGEEFDQSSFSKGLIERNVNADIAYMFIDGHYLKDNIIKPMLDLIRRMNKNNDISEIRTTFPEKRWKSEINEIENHFKFCCPTEAVIHAAHSYTSGLCWEMLQSKLKKIFSGI